MREVGRPEHVPDPERTVAEILRTLRSGGHAVFHGPNLLSPLTPLVKAARRLSGQETSPIYGRSVGECIAVAVRNVRGSTDNSQAATVWGSRFSTSCVCFDFGLLIQASWEGKSPLCQHE